MDLFVATGEAVLHYDPLMQELMVLSTEDARTGLYEASLAAAPIAFSPHPWYTFPDSDPFIPGARALELRFAACLFALL